MTYLPALGVGLCGTIAVLMAALMPSPSQPMAVIFAADLAQREAWLRVVRAGGQPIGRGYWGNVVIAAGDIAFMRAVRGNGALLLLNAEAMGCADANLNGRS